jgi:citrate synthase
MEIVPETAISDVDGGKNRIVIRGVDLAELAGKVSYEDMCALLSGSPASLGEARVRAASKLPRGLGLKETLASLDGEDLAAGVAMAAARFANPNAEPDPKASHAADLLRMTTGSTDAARARGLDTYLVALAENGMNTSTYVARIVASTGASDAAAVTAAYCALEGPLHGGAPGNVLDMLEAVAEPAKAAAWVAEEKASGRRIPGMGHRIFKGLDPRAAMLRSAAERLPAARHLRVADAIRDSVRGVLPNVELYTAVLLDAVGLPKELFTPMFAAARAAGWCAHIAEQRATGRLIQPNARYIGPSPK